MRVAAKRGGAEGGLPWFIQLAPLLQRQDQDWGFFTPWFLGSSDKCAMSSQWSLLRNQNGKFRQIFIYLPHVLLQDQYSGTGDNALCICLYLIYPKSCNTCSPSEGTWAQGQFDLGPRIHRQSLTVSAEHAMSKKKDLFRFFVFPPGGCTGGRPWMPSELGTHSAGDRTQSSWWFSPSTLLELSQ